MENKTTKSLFSLEIENNKEVHVLLTALSMVGLNVNMKAAELIKETLKAMEVMGGNFDLDTACKIKVKVEKKYDMISDNYKNQ